MAIGDTRGVVIDDTVLLDNLLDALDRLYDQKTAVIDLQALLTASSAGLEDQTMARAASTAAEDLTAILRRNLRPDEENRQALIATDKLRQMIAGTP
jgi:hypothetical protein